MRPLLVAPPGFYCVYDHNRVGGEPDKRMGCFSIARFGEEGAKARAMKLANEIRGAIVVQRVA